ncbi:ABC transporter ATP-binding protein [Microbacterium sp.]|uniref:ABC transporter ATP-binding protein n=1 Tax=Microbacterium sp. TaxID=51671 RepID=UPI003C75CF8E
MIYSVDGAPECTAGETDADAAISLREVRKSFAGREVLRGIDLTAVPGELIGLLGRNGAGKSTLIRVMSGLVRADAGHVRVGGVDVVRAPAGLGRRIGLAPQELGLYPQLTCRQNLAAFAEISGLRPAVARRSADDILDLLGLTPQAGQRAGTLSGGQKRRLHTGIALVHRPRVLFLDEPTVGADVASRAGILEVVRRMAADGATIVYTTHYLPELEELGARIAMLDGGRIVVDGPLGEVIDRHAKPTVRLRFRSAPPPVAGWRSDGRWLSPCEAVTDPGAALAQALGAPGVRTADLADVEVVRANLETAYLAICADHADEPDPSALTAEKDSHVTAA